MTKPSASLLVAYQALSWACENHEELPPNFRPVLAELKKRFDIEEVPGLPSGEQLEKALGEYTMDLFAFFVPPDIDVKLLEKMSQFEIQANHSEIDWSKEPEESRPDFDPSEHPKELQLHLRNQERAALLGALEMLRRSG